MSIGIVVTHRAADTVVAVDGDIDLQTAPELAQALAGVDGDVVVDLNGCQFLDSTALGVFVGTDNRLRPAGHTMTLVCANPRLLRVFRITRLDTLWPIRDRLDPAAPPA